MKETEQTLLDQIKDQVSKDKGFNDYDSFFSHDMNNILAMDSFMNVVCERYGEAKAKASCEATKNCRTGADCDEIQGCNLVARLLPKEEKKHEWTTDEIMSMVEKKPAQPTPNFPKGGTTFTESAYKEPQDKEPVYAPSESQEEPVLFADWLIKNGWEPQMTEGCWIQYAEEPIMKKTRELYQQFTITRNP